LLGESSVSREKIFLNIKIDLFCIILLYLINILYLNILLIQ